ncbi:MAG: glycoside hydrolase family 5 protein [Bacteroidales bacterium]|nr:glycoside hydrolase family 5 protein [Bacteroidales bacterium]
MLKRIFICLLAFVVSFAFASCDGRLYKPGEKGEPVKPEPAPDPKPEPGPVTEFETSFESITNMGVGWNLGNTLEPVWTGDTDGRDWRRWETGWGQSVTTQSLMNMMKNAGFGAIRVPVSWGVHMDADGKVYEEWMNRVNEVVDYVLNTGMYCIINIHHDTGADEELAWLVASPEGYSRERQKYENLWKQIALRFRDYGQRLLFESYNEMLDEGRSWCFASYSLGYDASVAAGAYQAINDYAQSFVDVVRATGGNNSVRNLVVNTYGACNGAGDWNPHLQDPLKNMKMPVDKVKDHILFQVHSYPKIDDLAAMEREVTQMLDDLETYLVSQGGPVIVGEWGTFSENPTLENYCHYAKWFAGECKRRGIGTFHWMNLSDGMYRSIPCFSSPELAEAIVKGYHGDGFTPVIPVIEDYNLDYQVTYRDLWSELNLTESSTDLSQYKGITFELDQTPSAGLLDVKIYGESEGKEQHQKVSDSSTTVMFDASQLGAKANRITLQYMSSTLFTITVKSVCLIRKDDTLEPCTPSAFWGCEVQLIVTG